MLLRHEITPDGEREQKRSTMMVAITLDRFRVVSFTAQSIYLYVFPVFLSLVG